MFANYYTPMTSDSYQQIMYAYGGRLLPASCHDSAWKRFASMKLMLETGFEQQKQMCRNNHDWRNSPVGIEFDLLANMRINAIAVSDGLTEGIGINAGLVAYIDNAVNALLNHNALFPEIGQSNVSATDEEVISSISTFDLRQGWGSCSPRDKMRSQRALYLSHIINTFVFYHELCHIAHGHLLHEDISTLDRNSYISEFRSPNDRVNSRLMQIFELDADEGAATASATIALAFSDKRYIGRLIEISHFDAVYCWALSIAILFRLLDLFSRSSSIDTLSSHPPPGVRTDHAMYCGRNWVRLNFPDHQPLFDTAVYKALQDISNLWERFGLKSISHTINADRRFNYIKELRDDMAMYDKSLLLDLEMRRKEILRVRYS